MKKQTFALPLNWSIERMEVVRDSSMEKEESLLDVGGWAINLKTDFIAIERRSHRLRLFTINTVISANGLFTKRQFLFDASFIACNGIVSRSELQRFLSIANARLFSAKFSDER